VEEQVRHDRDSPEEKPLYDGPRVSEACLDGAERKWPKTGMTFLLNQWFYYAVALIVIVTTVSLPPKHPAANAGAGKPTQSTTK
jgi:hypothetical protein